MKLCARWTCLLKCLRIFFSRTMLSAVESSATQSLRLTLTRQLAEVLLRGVSGTVYTSPEMAIDTGILYSSFLPIMSELRNVDEITLCA